MRFVVLGLGASLAACGSSGSAGPDAPEVVDCSQITGTDTFTVGLEHKGAAGAMDFKLMSATPAPPARGNNNWVVQINTMSAGVVGAPLTGASLNVTPFMPAHQHGTPIQVQITPSTTVQGEYDLNPVNLWMPGVWQTTIVASQGSSTDSAVYTFCIPN
jgi:hypothetical protein